MHFFAFIKSKPVVVIVLLAVLQSLCGTYFLDINQFHKTNSLLFLCCGTGIGLLILFVKPNPVDRSILLNKTLLLKLACFLPLLPYSYHVARGILDATPLQIEHADMLPVMKVMVNRFLNGQWSQVYDPIPEIWQGMQPIYLPAMWMPHVAANIFDFDMRWVTVSGVWLCIVLCMWPGKWRHAIAFSLCALALIAVLDWLHNEKTNNVIRLTEEGVVYFYYSLLAVAIICRNEWLTGLAAALCLMSRYALIGWIPFAGIYLLLIKEYRFFMKAAATGFAVSLVLLIPFGVKPLLLHLRQPEKYVAFTEKVWRENPDFFYHSLGVAKFFGQDAVRLQHTILMIGSFALPLCLLFFTWKRKLPFQMVLLSGLQLSVTFFYSFIDVSYIYLYYTPLLMSVVIAAWLFAIAGSEQRGNAH